MTDGCGLGQLELLMLESLDELGAGPDDAFVRSARVTGHASRAHGIGPAYGYTVLLDLARDWLVNLPLVDFHGNPGSVDFGPADSRYTEVRLNRLGRAVLDARLGEGPAVPVGLINGTVHVDGRDPPLDPRRVARGLRAAAADASDDELIDMIGLPSFPTGCEVVGDPRQFAAGEPTRMELRARFHKSAENRFVISHLPLRVGASEVSLTLMELADDPRSNRRLGIHDVNDGSTLETGIQIDVALRAGYRADDTIDQLRNIWGLHTVVDVQLPAPLPDLLRTWTATHGIDGLELLDAPTKRPGRRP